jgi:acyl-coenzyme A synthetase/AMP-(fatty) acid ligase
LTAIATARPAALASLRVVFSSGAPLEREVVSALDKAGGRIVQVFGSTETGGIAYRQGLDELWTPLPGVDVGCAGGDRLTVASPWLARDGPHPLITQDRVVLEARGFRHLGRADTVVKVGARRVDLLEIEAHLRGVPGVTGAVVLARPAQGALGTEILAVVETSAAGVTRDDLRRHLSGRLDVLPWRLRVVPQLPYTETGKLERQTLLGLFDNSP